MTTKSIRLNSDLIFQAQSASAVECRSIPNQVEYWANLGRIISSVIDMEDAFAIIQGLKTLRVEPIQTISIDPDAVFDQLEADRATGFADKPITRAAFYYEASAQKPGYLDRVDSRTGERKTGRFADGKFSEIHG